MENRSGRLIVTHKGSITVEEMNAGTTNDVKGQWPMEQEVTYPREGESNKPEAAHARSKVQKPGRKIKDPGASISNRDGQGHATSDTHIRGNPEERYVVREHETCGASRFTEPGMIRDIHVEADVEDPASGLEGTGELAPQAHQEYLTRDWDKDGDLKEDLREGYEDEDDSAGSDEQGIEDYIRPNQ